jgi:polysaccharide pyruvyl transferase WcaK-like protein
MMRRLRLFHFDIRTYGNYGDTLLFEAVRETFEGFAGGAAFEVYDSRPLRDPVGHKLVDYINANFDAVVVGGGGLFLRDTNPNASSGWQWNISLEQLRRIEKPLIVFAVGNNRFMGQPDFGDPFTEHVNLTLEKSVFFGLRNHGSIETVREYIRPENRDRVVYQPCPTTISSYLYPDLYRPSIDHERHLGVHSIVGKRQARAGFDAAKIYAAQADVLERLVREGWTVESLPHARADMKFHDVIAARGIPASTSRLWGDRDLLFRGVQHFADLPIMLGTRGHAQMVPFGMGAIPLSLHVHDKIRYFATDIGHAEWAIDPRADDFTDQLYRTVNEVHERQPALREELAGVREGFYRTTLDNLATIYERLTHERVEPSFTPLSPQARAIAERFYRYASQRDEYATELRDAGTEAKVAARIVRHASKAEAAGDRKRGRYLRRASELLVDPDAPTSTVRRGLRRVRRSLRK